MLSQQNGLSDIDAKCFTSSDYDKFTKEILKTKKNNDNRKELSDKSNLIIIYWFKPKICIISDKKKSQAEQDKIFKLQAFNSSYFCAQSHFEDDSTQSYKGFEAFHRYFQRLLIAIVFQRGK